MSEKEIKTLPVETLERLLREGAFVGKRKKLAKKTLAQKRHGQAPEWALEDS